MFDMGIIDIRLPSLDFGEIETTLVHHVFSATEKMGGKN